jgi:hypothetical protein
MSLRPSSRKRGPLRSSLLAVIALAAAAAGCGAPLVGGTCADGYEVQGEQCVAAHPDVSSSAGGTGGSSPACAPGRTVCAGTCVDVTRDPHNCGTCGNACVMEACIVGACTAGAVEKGAVGAALILGLDFTEAVPGDASARLLDNAVYLAAHDPVRILDYRELTTWNASTVTNTVDLIADGATKRGRGVETTVAAQWAEVPSLLTSGAYDVLFVHDLDAAQPGQLAVLGAAWSASLLSFLQSGGVAVFIATDGGVNEMGDFLSSSAILHVSMVESAATERLFVQGTADALAAGLAPSLGLLPGSASFVAADPPGPSLAYVVVTSGKAPVVLHRAWYPTTAGLGP